MSRAAELFAPLDESEFADKVTPKSKTENQPIVPVPDDAPEMQFRHPKHGLPSRTWSYQDINGRLVGYVCRWDYCDTEGKAEKTFLPISFCDLRNDQRGWCAAGFPKPRLLYGLPGFAEKPDAIILIVEGEKSAAAAAALFPEMVATTPPHGAKSPGKADWRPLRGRKAIIWPDHDDTGRDFADIVARLAWDAGAEDVRIVDVQQDFPEKWDLADSPPAGWDFSGLRALIENAHTADGDELDIHNADDGVHYPFRLTNAAVEYRDDNDDGGEWVFVCSRLEVAAVTRNDRGEDWGRLLVLRDRDGNVHEFAMPMEMLAGSGEEYRRRLLSMGLEIAPGPKTRSRLHQYISACHPGQRARCVSRIGWHHRCFILPDQTFGDTRGERVLLQVPGTFDHAFAVRGTLKGWQDNVAKFAAGNSRLVFSLSVAFAAPLLKLVASESGGIHLRGSSSIGKTTALAVASSAWGGGGIKGYIRQWRATDNGLEAVAQAHCDALLCLDELSQIDAKAAGQTAYMLANGAGKSRAGRSGEGRTPAEWRVLFLSTGEIGLADKIAEDGRGRRIAAGQEVRVIDLPADAGAGLGLFENIHDADNADAFARHLSKAATEHYGVAAHEYLSEIAGDPDGVEKAVLGFKAEFAGDTCPKSADGQVSRAADRFGLIAAAGELAISLGILPLERGEAARAAKTCFLAWLDGRGGTEAAEVTAAISKVRLFIEQHGESRFATWEKGANAERPTINRAGFRKPDGDGGVEYYVLPGVWKTEVCAGFDPVIVARALLERGLLIPDGSDKKFQSRHRLPGSSGPQRCYRLSAKILGALSDA